MLDKARQLIQKYACGKRVAAAVSGGEDSMALLSLLCEYAEAGKLALCVLNVDHGIRKNSASDSEFVRRFCRGRGVEFIGIEADIPKLCKKSGRGIECEAHFFRREFFEKTISEGKVDIVVTAHHAKDNAETVLMHLFRGAGLKGLSGMKVFDGRIFRPFITTPKAEISEYVKARNIEYVVDETNADVTYDRNYIRNEVLPLIEARFPSYENAVARAAAFAADADGSISSQLDGSAFSESDGAVFLDENRLSAPYIFEALSRMGKTSDVYFSTVDRIIGLKNSRQCARADIGDGIVAAREYGKIAFYRGLDKSAAEETPFESPCSDSRITTAFGTAEIKRAYGCGFDKTGQTLVFDADKLPCGCVWRTRREGDRFAPYGCGEKKLKEYLIDKKVPLRKRDGLMLLCCGKEVFIVCGMQISDRIKVTEDSVNVFSVSLCT